MWEDHKLPTRRRSPPKRKRKASISVRREARDSTVTQKFALNRFQNMTQRKKSPKMQRANQDLNLSTQSRAALFHRNLFLPWREASVKEWIAVLSLGTASLIYR